MASALPCSAQPSCSHDTGQRSPRVLPSLLYAAPVLLHGPATAFTPSSSFCKSSRLCTPKRSCPPPVRLCATSPVGHSLHHWTTPDCMDHAGRHGPHQLPFHCTAQLTPRRQCSFQRFPVCYSLHLLTAQLPCEHSSTGPSLPCALPTALPSLLLVPQPSNAP